MEQDRHAELERPKKGDQWVAYPGWRPSARLFIEVTRVAKDGSWVDIRVMTWACSWAKRMKREWWPGDDMVKRPWGVADFVEQQADNEIRLREEGVLT